jgi:hypothetical protein
MSDRVNTARSRTSGCHCVWAAVGGRHALVTQLEQHVWSDGSAIVRSIGALCGTDVDDTAAVMSVVFCRPNTHPNY